MNIFKKYKTGLILSGGGIRGMAHLGVLKYLSETNSKISVISGTSAGALVGALYADGYAPEEILEMFMSKKVFHLMRLTFPRTGFLKVDGLRRLLTKNLKSKRVEDLSIPLHICATNYTRGRPQYFSQGNLVDILLASSCIPVLFEIQKLGQDYYFDGGVMDNLPLKPIENKCRKYIAVHVNPAGDVHQVKTPVQVGERAFHLAIASGINNVKNKVDYFIEPQNLSDYGMLDLKKAKEIFDAGYFEARKVLAK